MRRVAALLLAACGAAHAASSGIAGDWTHDYAEPAGTPVFRIAADGEGWSVTRTGDGAVVQAHELDAAAREALWRRYDWPVATARDARCIGWHEDDAAPLAAAWTSVLCTLPADARRAIAWLADGRGDGFYADAALGVMDVRKLP